MTHPITPPPELVEEWAHLFVDHTDTEVFSAVAQWGADQELEACCEWLDRNNQWARVDIDELHDARRPKPPSLKEQALAELAEWENVMDIASDSPIRRALEAFPDD
jgi:hypothetical protein